jgi:hypothetical protein
LLACGGAVARLTLARGACCAEPICAGGTVAFALGDK